MKEKKKGILPLNKILEVRENLLDYSKKSNKLKKSELQHKKEVIEENSKLIDSKIDNASKQIKNDFIEQKAKIDRNMVKSDVNTGKMCNVVGVMASVSSCIISIIGMFSRFPNGITRIVLCTVFLFFGVAIFFSNTALQKHKNRFEEKENGKKNGGLLSKWLSKLLKIISNNTFILRLAIPTYLIMSVASNFIFFEKLVNDKSAIGWLTVVGFSIMLDIISFGLSGIADTFINLNYNEKTIKKIMGESEEKEDKPKQNKINLEDVTNKEPTIPLDLNFYTKKKTEDVEEVENKEDEKVSVVAREEKPTEDKSKRGRKKDCKNAEIASAICHDIKDKLANEEAEVLEKAKKRGLSGKELEDVLNSILFNKKIILKYLSDNIKKKYNLYTTTDIVKRIYDPTRDYLMSNGYLRKNPKTNRTVININYEKAAKCNEIIEKSKTLV